MQTYTYDAANQVSGWSYDAAGNLLGDGSTTYSYDALNRTTQRGSTAFSYNGDGTLVSQTTGGVITRYRQDLAVPLSQLLQSTVGSNPTTDYVYGHERLFARQGTTQTWYSSDALASVRQTLTASGAPRVSVDSCG